MLVNFARKRFFSGMSIAMLSVFLIASSFAKDTHRDVPTKQVNIMIRQLGHRLLLQAGDSLSRVLPVTETTEGTFELSFENEFYFNDDSLIELSQRLLPEALFPSGYTVTVHDCSTADIVYGFQFSHSSADILPCRGRSQPMGRYRIEIDFPDLYVEAQGKKMETKKVDIDRPKEALAKTKEFKGAAFQTQSLLTSQPDKSSSILNLVFSGVLVLLGVTLLIGSFGKISKPKPTTTTPELPVLGKFRFDVKDRRLLLADEVISLTEKECQVLELLHKNFGELIPRETLMQRIWINEGVITGRSLDMFVSKLRKKLSGDPELRITNVHGKGYKLETLQ